MHLGLSMWKPQTKREIAESADCCVDRDRAERLGFLGAVALPFVFGYIFSHNAFARVSRLWVRLTLRPIVAPGCGVL